MTEIGIFTPEQARLLWQDFQTRQTLRPQASQNYPTRRTPDEVSPHRVFIRNDSGETLPAYGCAEITGTATVAGRTVVTVDKPSSTTGEYLFCSQFSIADGDVGWAYRYGVIIMLGDAPSSAGVQYKPTVSAWTVEEGDGPFVVFGVDDADDGTLIGRFGSSVSTTTITNAAGACGCGTQYGRGSQLVTVNSVDYEHATTYTITPSCYSGTWIFPEATYDTGDDWVTGVEDLYTCYGGALAGELTLTPCGYRTVCGQDVLQAKIVLSTTADTCSVDDDPAAVWLCDNWNPLGPTSLFYLVSPTVVGLSTWRPPSVLCVTPKAATWSTVCGVELAGPPMFGWNITISPPGNYYEGIAYGGSGAWSGSFNGCTSGVINMNVEGSCKVNISLSGAGTCAWIPATTLPDYASSGTIGLTGSGGGFGSPTSGGTLTWWAIDV